MNRADTTVLLRRITAQSPTYTKQASPETIDEWHRQLERYDPPAVYAALDRITQAGERVVHLANLIAEIRSRLRVEPDATPMPEPVPILPRERIREIVMAGIEEGHRQRYDRADEEHRARIEWFRKGMPGHYPGCRCDRCAGTGKIADEDVRAKLAALPPLPGYPAGPRTPGPIVETTAEAEPVTFDEWIPPDTPA